MMEKVVIVPHMLRIVDRLISKNLAAENFGKFLIRALPNSSKYFFSIFVIFLFLSNL